MTFASLRPKPPRARAYWLLRVRAVCFRTPGTPWDPQLTKEAAP